MSKLTLILCFLSLILIPGCSSEKNPAEPDGGKDQLLTSGIIGSNGGSLLTDFLTVKVPAGSFTTDAELKIYVSGDPSPFGTGSLSDLFRVDGIPANYDKPIEIKLKYKGSLSGRGFVGVGEDVFVSTLGKTTKSYRLAASVDSAGHLLYQLPAPSAGQASFGLFKNTMSDASVMFEAVKGPDPVTTSANHFRLSTSLATVSVAQLQALGTLLEEAYIRIAQLGFSYTARTSWPVDVTVRDLGTQAYGYYSSSMFGNNHGTMEFNSQKLGDSGEMRISAGHELMHLVQALYDPRNSYSKAKFSSDHYWLDEATAVWIEAKFTNQPNYVSSVRSGQEMAPFDGMQKGAEDNGQLHGYGMSAVIQYLLSRFGEDRLVQMYNQILTNAKTVDAISASTENPSAWLETFFRQYILGQIYNLQTSFWVGNAHGDFSISTSKDTLKTFACSSPDLSARLYKVRLNNSSIDQNASLRIKTEGGSYHVSVLRYNSSTIEFLNEAEATLMISNMRELTTQGWHLLVLVTNPRMVSPYNGTSNMNVEFKVMKGLPFKECGIIIEYTVDYKVEHPNDPDYTPWTLSDWGEVAAGWAEGGFNGNQFTGSWDTLETNGWFDRGSITLTLNDDLSQILEFELSQTSGWLPSTALAMEESVSIRGSNVPFDKGDPSYRDYLIEGIQTCNSISYLTVAVDFPPDSRWTMLSYRCDEGSQINMTLWALLSGSSEQHWIWMKQQATEMKQRKMLERIQKSTK